MKEIARQAGLSLATVERVLNRRPGVRVQTIKRVEDAVAELETQSSHLVMSGRTLVLDLIVEAPQYFIQALKEAIVGELPTLHAPAFRMRIDACVHFPEDELYTALSRTTRRGSDGVILMGPAVPVVRSAIDGLEAGGIPVVTLASDVMPSRSP
jgi:LacI family transcriptional regulator